MTGTLTKNFLYKLMHCCSSEGLLQIQRLALVKKGPTVNLRGNAQGEVAAQAVVVRDEGPGVSATWTQTQTDITHQTHSTGYYNGQKYMASLQAYDGYMTTNDYMDMAEQM
ncbi:MAG: hypothetical protein FRX49_12967 [Trebouxia sp. A1-2]|nr:MAG: hypothetical protein FRX49_12967 [Trebouxia sp. A1-2]